MSEFRSTADVVPCDCERLKCVKVLIGEGKTSLHHQRRDRDLKEFIDVKPLVPANMTYIDKEENVLSVPKFKREDEHKTKKKITKKSPKRTIQKIIKKNRVHKKSCKHLHTSVPTKPPMDGDAMDLYANEDEKPKKENLTTPHVKEKKKYKWANKVSRYPMPFHKLQSMKEHRRNRRSDSRDDLFVLTDLDEIEFLDNDNKDKDTQVVNAHVKKYW